MSIISVRSLLAVSVVAGLSGVGGMAQAEALTVYGKAHVSADYINYTDSSDVAMGSNSSRIGFKGDKSLPHGLKVVWKFENEIDLMAESKPLSARNRYVGLSHSAGTMIAGYHDTPFKTFGGKAGVFHDTIGERRGVLGAGNGSNKFNIRARNSVMYISPKIAGLEVRAIGSTGDDTDSSNDAGSMFGASAVYATKMLYAGVAYEDQTNLSATEGTGLRVGAGAKFGTTSVNAMYEKLSSTNVAKFDRAAYGGSVVHGVGPLALKAQVFLADDYTGQADSGGMLYAVGADYSLDKSFKLYAVYAGVSNDANSQIVLAGSGHGEKYTPAAGDSLSGISAGMVYKF